MPLVSSCFLLHSFTTQQWNDGILQCGTVMQYNNQWYSVIVSGTPEVPLCDFMMENMNYEEAASEKGMQYEQQCNHGDKSDQSSVQAQDSAYVSLGQSRGSSTPCPSKTSSLPPSSAMMTKPDSGAKQEQISALVTNLTEVWQRSKVTSSQHHQIHQLLGSGQHKEWVYISMFFKNRFFLH